MIEILEAYCQKCKTVLGSVKIDTDKPLVAQERKGLLQSQVVKRHNDETIRTMANGGIMGHSVRIITPEIREAWEAQDKD